MILETKEKILHTALVEFAKYGFDNISLREIAFNVGISMNTLTSQFRTKEDLLEGILDYIPMRIEQCAPSPEEIREMLKIQTPAELLSCAYTYNNWNDDYLFTSIYRFLYMEQYRNDRIKETTYKYLVKLPVNNLKSTLEILVDQGAIPRCDSRAIAEMWVRTSLVYGIHATHKDYAPSHREYYDIGQFFIGIATQGVRHIPVNSIKTEWKSRLQWESNPNKMDMKQKIMMKALDLFSAHGYENISLKTISNEVNISVSTIYRYYSSKSDIMKEITLQILDGFNHYTADNPVFQALLQTKDPSQIILSLSNFYSPSKEGKVLQLYRMLFREQYYNDDLRDFFLGMNFRDRQVIVDTLNQLIKSGSVRACDSEKIATAYVYSMCTLTIASTVYPDDYEKLEHIKLRIIAVLMSLILYGYQNTIDVAASRIASIKVVKNETEDSEPARSKRSI